MPLRPNPPTLGGGGAAPAAVAGGAPDNKKHKRDKGELMQLFRAVGRPALAQARAFADL